MLVLKGTLYSQFTRQPESVIGKAIYLTKKLVLVLYGKPIYLKRIQSVIGLASSPNENV